MQSYWTTSPNTLLLLSSIDALSHCPYLLNNFRFYLNVTLSSIIPVNLWCLHAGDPCNTFTSQLFLSSSLFQWSCFLLLPTHPQDSYDYTFVFDIINNYSPSMISIPWSPFLISVFYISGLISSGTWYPYSNKPSSPLQFISFYYIFTIRHLLLYWVNLKSLTHILCSPVLLLLCYAVLRPGSVQLWFLYSFVCSTSWTRLEKKIELCWLVSL